MDAFKDEVALKVRLGHPSSDNAEIIVSTICSSIPFARSKDPNTLIPSAIAILPDKAIVYVGRNALSEPICSSVMVRTISSGVNNTFHSAISLMDPPNHFLLIGPNCIKPYKLVRSENTSSGWTIQQVARDWVIPSEYGEIRSACVSSDSRFIAIHSSSEHIHILYRTESTADPSEMFTFSHIPLPPPENTGPVRSFCWNYLDSAIDISDISIPVCSLLVTYCDGTIHVYTERVHHGTLEMCLQPLPPSSLFPSSTLAQHAELPSISVAWMAPPSASSVSSRKNASTAASGAKTASASVLIPDIEYSPHWMWNAFPSTQSEPPNSDTHSGTSIPDSEDPKSLTTLPPPPKLVLYDPLATDAVSSMDDAAAAAAAAGTVWQSHVIPEKLRAAHGAVAAKSTHMGGMEHSAASSQELHPSILATQRGSSWPIWRAPAAHTSAPTAATKDKEVDRKSKTFRTGSGTGVVSGPERVDTQLSLGSGVLPCESEGEEEVEEPEEVDLQHPPAPEWMVVCHSLLDTNPSAPSTPATAPPLGELFDDADDSLPPWSVQLVSAFPQPAVVSSLTLPPVPLLRASTGNASSKELSMTGCGCPEVTTVSSDPTAATSSTSSALVKSQSIPFRLVRVHATSDQYLAQQRERYLSLYPGASVRRASRTPLNVGDKEPNADGKEAKEGKEYKEGKYYSDDDYNDSDDDANDEALNVLPDLESPDRFRLAKSRLHDIGSTVDFLLDGNGTVSLSNRRTTQEQSMDPIPAISASRIGSRVSGGQGLPGEHAGAGGDSSSDPASPDFTGPPRGFLSTLLALSYPGEAGSDAREVFLKQRTTRYVTAIITRQADLDRSRVQQAVQQRAESSRGLIRSLLMDRDPTSPETNTSRDVPVPPPHPLCIHFAIQYKDRKTGAECTVYRELLVDSHAQECFWALPEVPTTPSEAGTKESTASSTVTDPLVPGTSPEASTRNGQNASSPGAAASTTETMDSAANLEAENDFIEQLYTYLLTNKMQNAAYMLSALAVSVRKELVYAGVALERGKRIYSEYRAKMRLKAAEAAAAASASAALAALLAAQKEQASAAQTKPKGGPFSGASFTTAGLKAKAKSSSTSQANTLNSTAVPHVPQPIEHDFDEEAFSVNHDDLESLFYTGFVQPKYGSINLMSGEFVFGSKGSVRSKLDLFAAIKTNDLAECKIQLPPVLQADFPDTSFLSHLQLMLQCSSASAASKASQANLSPPTDRAPAIDYRGVRPRAAVPRKKYRVRFGAGGGKGSGTGCSSDSESDLYSSDSETEGFASEWGAEEEEKRKAPLPPAYVSASEWPDVYEYEALPHLPLDQLVKVTLEYTKKWQVEQFLKHGANVHFLSRVPATRARKPSFVLDVKDEMDGLGHDDHSSSDLDSDADSVSSSDGHAHRPSYPFSYTSASKRRRAAEPSAALVEYARERYMTGYTTPLRLIRTWFRVQPYDSTLLPTTESILDPSPHQQLQLHQSMLQSLGNGDADLINHPWDVFSIPPAPTAADLALLLVAVPHIRFGSVHPGTPRHTLLCHLIYLFARSTQPVGTGSVSSLDAPATFFLTNAYLQRVLAAYPALSLTAPPTPVAAAHAAPETDLPSSRPGAAAAPGALADAQQKFRQSALCQAVGFVPTYSAFLSNAQDALLEAVFEVAAQPVKAPPGSPATAAPDTNSNGAEGEAALGVGVGFREGVANAFSWKDLSFYRLPLWLRDVELLANAVERIGKAAFLLSGRDPFSTVLPFLSLGLQKLPLVRNCFRLSPTHAKVYAFLGNDFRLPKYQQSAEKNAFSLLSQHRYEAAAGFFLLAKKPAQCLRVVLQHLGNPTMALAIARLTVANGYYSQSPMEFLSPKSKYWSDVPPSVHMQATSVVNQAQKTLQNPGQTTSSHYSQHGHSLSSFSNASSHAAVASTSSVQEDYDTNPFGIPQDDDYYPSSSATSAAVASYSGSASALEPGANGFGFDDEMDSYVTPTATSLTAASTTTVMGVSTAHTAVGSLSIFSSTSYSITHGTSQANSARETQNPASLLDSDPVRYVLEHELKPYCEYVIETEGADATAGSKASTTAVSGYHSDADMSTHGLFHSFLSAAPSAVFRLPEGDAHALYSLVQWIQGDIFAAGTTLLLPYATPTLDSWLHAQPAPRRTVPATTASSLSSLSSTPPQASPARRSFSSCTGAAAPGAAGSLTGFGTPLRSAFPMSLPGTASSTPGAKGAASAPFSPSGVGNTACAVSSASSSATWNSASRHTALLYYQFTQSLFNSHTYLSHPSIRTAIFLASAKKEILLSLARYLNTYKLEEYESPVHYLARTLIDLSASGCGSISAPMASFSMQLSSSPELSVPLTQAGHVFFTMLCLETSRDIHVSHKAWEYAWSDQAPVLQNLLKSPHSLLPQAGSTLATSGAPTAIGSPALFAASRGSHWGGSGAGTPTGKGFASPNPQFAVPDRGDVSGLTSHRASPLVAGSGFTDERGASFPQALLPLFLPVVTGMYRDAFKYLGLRLVHVMEYFYSLARWRGLLITFPETTKTLLVPLPEEKPEVAGSAEMRVSASAGVRGDLAPSQVRKIASATSAPSIVGNRTQSIANAMPNTSASTGKISSTTTTTKVDKRTELLNKLCPLSSLPEADAIVTSLYSSLIRALKSHSVHYVLPAETFIRRACRTAQFANTPGMSHPPVPSAAYSYSTSTNDKDGYLPFGLLLGTFLTSLRNHFPVLLRTWCKQSIERLSEILQRHPLSPCARVSVPGKHGGLLLYSDGQTLASVRMYNYELEASLQNVKLLISWTMLFPHLKQLTHQYAPTPHLHIKPLSTTHLLHDLYAVAWVHSIALNLSRGRWRQTLELLARDLPLVAGNSRIESVCPWLTSLPLLLFFERTDGWSENHCLEDSLETQLTQLRTSATKSAVVSGTPIAVGPSTSASGGFIGLPAISVPMHCWLQLYARAVLSALCISHMLRVLLSPPPPGTGFHNGPNSSNVSNNARSGDSSHFAPPPLLIQRLEKWARSAYKLLHTGTIIYVLPHSYWRSLCFQHTMQIQSDQEQLLAKASGTATAGPLPPFSASALGGAFGMWGQHQPPVCTPVMGSRIDLSRPGVQASWDVTALGEVDEILSPLLGLHGKDDSGAESLISTLLGGGRTMQSALEQAKALQDVWTEDTDVLNALQVGAGSSDASEKSVHKEAGSVLSKLKKGKDSADHHDKHHGGEALTSHLGKHVAFEDYEDPMPSLDMPPSNRPVLRLLQRDWNMLLGPTSGGDIPPNLITQHGVHAIQVPYVAMLPSTPLFPTNPPSVASTPAIGSPIHTHLSGQPHPGHHSQPIHPPLYSSSTHPSVRPAAASIHSTIESTHAHGVGGMASPRGAAGIPVPANAGSLSNTPLAMSGGPLMTARSQRDLDPLSPTLNRSRAQQPLLQQPQQQYAAPPASTANPSTSNANTQNLPWWLEVDLLFPPTTPELCSPLDCTSPLVAVPPSKRLFLRSKRPPHPEGHASDLRSLWCYVGGAGFLWLLAADRTILSNAYWRRKYNDWVPGTPVLASNILLKEPQGNRMVGFTALPYLPLPSTSHPQSTGSAMDAHLNDPNSRYNCYTPPFCPPALYARGISSVRLTLLTVHPFQPVNHEVVEIFQDVITSAELRHAMDSDRTGAGGVPGGETPGSQTPFVPSLSLSAFLKAGNGPSGAAQAPPALSLTPAIASTAIPRTRSRHSLSFLEQTGGSALSDVVLPNTTLAKQQLSQLSGTESGTESVTSAAVTTPFSPGSQFDADFFAQCPVVTSLLCPVPGATLHDRHDVGRPFVLGANHLSLHPISEKDIHSSFLCNPSCATSATSFHPAFGPFHFLSQPSQPASPVNSSPNPTHPISSHSYPYGHSELALPSTKKYPFALQYIRSGPGTLLALMEMRCEPHPGFAGHAVHPTRPSQYVHSLLSILSPTPVNIEHCMLPPLVPRHSLQLFQKHLVPMHLTAAASSAISPMHSDASSALLPPSLFSRGGRPSIHSQPSSYASNPSSLVLSNPSSLVLKESSRYSIAGSSGRDTSPIAQPLSSPFPPSIPPSIAPSIPPSIAPSVPSGQRRVSQSVPPSAIHTNIPPSSSATLQRQASSYSIPTPASPHPVPPVPSVTDRVAKSVWSPDASKIFSIEYNGMIRVWERVKVPTRASSAHANPHKWTHTATFAVPGALPLQSSPSPSFIWTGTDLVCLNDEGTLVAVSAAPLLTRGGPGSLPRRGSGGAGSPGVGNPSGTGIGVAGVAPAAASSSASSSRRGSDKASGGKYGLPVTTCCGGGSLLRCDACRQGKPHSFEDGHPSYADHANAGCSITPALPYAHPLEWLQNRPVDSLHFFTLEEITPQRMRIVTPLDMPPLTVSPRSPLYPVSSDDAPDTRHEPRQLPRRTQLSLKRGLTTLLYSKSTGLLFAGGADGSIVSIDMLQFQLVAHIPGESLAPPTSLAMRPSVYSNKVTGPLGVPRTVVGISGTNSTHLKLFSTHPNATPNIPSTYNLHSPNSPNINANINANINTRGSHCHHPRYAHSGAVTALAFSVPPAPDTAPLFVVSGGIDGSIRLWSMDGSIGHVYPSVHASLVQTQRPQWESQDIYIPLDQSHVPEDIERRISFNGATPNEILVEAPANSAVKGVLGSNIIRYKVPASGGNPQAASSAMLPSNPKASLANRLSRSFPGIPGAKAASTSQITSALVDTSKAGAVDRLSPLSVERNRLSFDHKLEPNRSDGIAHVTYLPTPAIASTGPKEKDKSFRGSHKEDSTQKRANLPTALTNWLCEDTGRILVNARLPGEPAETSSHMGVNSKDARRSFSGKSGKSGVEGVIISLFSRSKGSDKSKHGGHEHVDKTSGIDVANTADAQADIGAGWATRTGVSCIYMTPDHIISSGFDGSIIATPLQW